MIFGKDEAGNDTLLIRQSWWGQWIECNERARRQIIDPDADVSGDAAACGTAMHAAIEDCINGRIGPDEMRVAARDAAHRILDTEPVKFQTFDTIDDFIEMAGLLAEAWGRDIWPTLPKGGRTEVPFTVHDLLRVEGIKVGITGTADYVLPDTVWDWKGLALDTPIATPDGWTTIGELEVGDFVFGTDGLPIEVIGKSEVNWRDCYRVTFKDGESIVTDDVHRWAVRDANGYPTVKATPDLMSMCRPGYIMAPSALKLPEAELPMDPYVLGYWLGDGTTGKAEFTVGTADLEHVLVTLAQAGYPSKVRRTNTAHTVVVTHNLKRDLLECGALADKSIPSIYLRASIDQRLALLQGLMDSDGGWNRARQSCSFDNVRPHLTDAVCELVASFGWKYSRFSAKPRGFQNAKPYHRMTFTPTGNLNPFLLPRKAQQAAACPPKVQSPRRYFRSVERIPTVPTQCIAVAAPDHLFLAGRAMVPTHNSSGKRYDHKKVQKFYHQPTIYSLAAVEGGFGGSYSFPMEFTYGVVVRNKKPACQTLTVVRNEEHVDWLLHRIEQAVKLYLRMGLDNEWPTIDTGFLCSDRWCAWYDKCRGARVSWQSDKIGV